MRMFILVLALSLALPVLPALAEEAVKIPAVDEALLADDAPFILSQDTPTIVNLPADAGSVLVGNPEHAQAVVENPRLVMLMPRRPGATSLTVLDTKGKLIMSRKVLVGGTTKTGTLRINRVCKPNDGSCNPTKVYNCAGRCYETIMPSVRDAGTLPPQPEPLPAAAVSAESSAIDTEVEDPTAGVTEAVQEQMQQIEKVLPSVDLEAQ